MATRISFRCPVCDRMISRHAITARCDTCACHIHRNCTLFCKNDFNDRFEISQAWSCQLCNAEIFAYNHIEDDNMFFNAIHELRLDRPLLNNVYIEDNLVFNPFEMNEEDNDFPCADIDPDSLYFNRLGFQLNSNCNYYNEDEFNSRMTNMNTPRDAISMIHLNIRSIAANLTNFLAYLENIQLNFSVIALSETWLRPDTQDCYNIPGYNHVSLVRPNNAGGGVSLFIQEHIEFRERHDLYTVDSFLECIFIELLFKNIKFVIGVVYRPPNSDVHAFNECLGEKLMSLKQNSSVPVYILGDYNLDLLKLNEHGPTADHLDIMFSSNLMPLINKPTRVTEATATLIDNIYTNNIDINNIALHGIFTTKLTDHFPVFHISYKQNLQSDPNADYQIIRQMGERNVSAYTEKIDKFDWSQVQEYQNCQEAFSFFHTSLKQIFDSSFPLIRVKRKYRNRLPWLTEELKESIKVKNKLYRVQDRHPTSQNKVDYAAYRNKLTSRMRKQEKIFYQNLIIENKQNLRKTWSIIKDVINKK